jgi:uncharacterized protein (DUF488 family)
MNSLATIGYEGATPEAFDAVIGAAEVELLVDVRAVALSRRPGFSKTTLSTRLREQGVDYVHLRGLGDPKPGREAARSGNHALFRAIFGAHLATDEAKRDLATLEALALRHRVALLCFEADAAGCHRSIVANAIATARNMSIVHLRVERGQANIGGRARTNNRAGESLAAA